MNRRRGSERETDERGVVVVWLAIMLVLFMGVSAFAIDIAYWHLVKGREQRAADAATLAGAISFPGDAAKANAAAKDVAGSNGYSVGSITSVGANASCPLGSASTSVCGGPGSEFYQYKVTVSQKVNNIFGGIFGIGSTTVRATATAEYLKPLQMGSPSNQFGNDPDNSSWPINTSSPPSEYPNFWANINGGGTAKQQGDAYAANWCDSSGGNLVTDGCAAQGDGNNTDYKAEGYFYAVDFTSAGSANLQVFDPALVNVGQFCTDNNTTHLGDASNLASIPSYPQGPNPADIHKRFLPVVDNTKPNDPGFQYCTGDNTFPNSAGNTVPPATTYRVLKATVPGDPSTAQQVCGPVTYPGYNGNVATPLANGTTLPGAPAAFATYFRQWVSLCSVSGDVGDEYFIQVSTNNGGGSNHFAMRGVSSGNNPAPVTIAGNTYMGIYANVGSNQSTKFYVVRIPTAARGHILVLNFYDIGDANSTGQLTIVPPPDNTGNPFTSNSCTWTGNSSNGAQGFASNTPQQPWGDLTPITGCTIPGVNGIGVWNAQWSSVRIPIPSDYSCSDDDPNGCWFTINYLFNGVVHDVTSWNAFLIGDPVRLTK